MTYGNGVFVLANYMVNINSNNNNRDFIYSMIISSDFVHWNYPMGNQIVETPNADPYYYTSGFITFGGNQFCFFIQGNNPAYVSTSSDGNSWTSISPIQISPYVSLNSLAYGQGTIVAIDSFGRNIYQSDVFTSDTNSPAPTTLGISTYAGVSINGMPGAVYQIQSSTDMNTWQTLTNFMLPSSPYIWVDTSSTVTGQKFYRSVQLQ